jgi:hypothetical protein
MRLLPPDGAPSMRAGGATDGVGGYGDSPPTFTYHQRLGRHRRTICENSLGSLDVWRRCMGEEIGIWVLGRDSRLLALRRELLRGRL